MSPDYITPVQTQEATRLQGSQQVSRAPEPLKAQPPEESAEFKGNDSAASGENLPLNRTNESGEQTRAGQVESAVSRISDFEMARINVEASSGLARWIELLRDDLQQYRALVRAACSLPMQRIQARRSSDCDQLLMLTDPRLVAAVATRLDSETARRARQNAEAHPTRMLANSLIHVTWRNGPVEDIHAGRHSSYPLTQRRIAAAEDGTLTSTTAGRLEYGLRAVYDLLGEKSERSWVEKVLPCGVASFLAPYRWSLIEQTRMVELYGKDVPVDMASP